MYDQNFGGTPSPFSKSTNFLSGQTHITTITAIQVLEDKSGINNGVLAVYGTDAAGVPYLGYVSQGGTAGQSEFPAVSTNPVFPATTVSQPLLASQKSRMSSFLELVDSSCSEVRVTLVSGRLEASL